MGERAFAWLFLVKAAVGVGCLCLGECVSRGAGAPHQASRPADHSAWQCLPAAPRGAVPPPVPQPVPQWGDVRAPLAAQKLRGSSLRVLQPPGAVPSMVDGIGLPGRPGAGMQGPDAAHSYSS